MDSTSRAEVMKPVYLKAGIPLALSAAAFICSKIITRRSLNSIISSKFGNQVPDSFQSDYCERNERLFAEVCDRDRNSTSEEIISGTDPTNSIVVPQNQPNIHYEQEILGLRSRIEELEQRELVMNTQFARYRGLKERESNLMEMKNILLLEMAYVELLNREISSMEAESKRLESLVIEYLRVLDQVEYWKSQNELLQRKVKKLLKKTKEQSRVVREKNMKIEATESESLRNCIRLEEISNDVKKLKDELRESESVVDQLQVEKTELLRKLELAEQSAASTSEIAREGIIMEDYKQLENENEQLRMARAAEVKELVYLRWINACLRYELAKNHAQEEQNQEENLNDVGSEFGGEIKEYGGEQEQQLVDTNNNDNTNVADDNSNSHACSKRRRFIQKLKKWVDGGDKEKHEIDKCFRRHSASHETEEDHLILARKSCSSV